MIFTLMAAVLIAIAGVYSVGMVGVTGGPAKGEHPLIVTIVHIFAFGATGKHWRAVSQNLYWNGLWAALVLSVIALLLTYFENRWWRVLVRIPLALLYVGFLVVLFKRH